MEEKQNDTKKTLLTCGVTLAGMILMAFLFLFAGGKVLRALGFIYTKKTGLILFLVSAAVTGCVSQMIVRKPARYLLETQKASRNNVRVIFVIFDMMLMMALMLLTDSLIVSVRAGFMPVFVIAFFTAVLCSREFKNES